MHITVEKKENIFSYIYKGLLWSQEMRWVIRNLGSIWQYVMMFYSRKLRMLLLGFPGAANDD